MEGKDQLGTRVRRILVASLPQNLRVSVAPGQGDASPRYDVTVQAGATDHRFIAGWAGEGWPADVEELIRHVPEVEVAVATNLSEGARDALARLGVGWIDEAGHAAINRTSGLVVSREPAHPWSRPKPSARWSRSTLAVAEAALSGVVPTVENIERETGLSRSATATGLHRLEQFGYLERPQALRGPMSGRRIVDTDALLDAYATAAAELRSKKPLFLVHRLWIGDAVETLRTEIAPALGASTNSWAVTGSAASVFLAPYLSDVTTLELYVDGDLFSDREGLANRLGGRVVERGHVIEVRELPTMMSAKGPVIAGVSLALPVRVYADLRAAGGRAAEAAQHLLEVRGVGSDS
jgi:hypothetical protein